MTREEAIRRIENHIEHHHIGEYPHIFIGEALGMTISALKEHVSLEKKESDKRYKQATSDWISVEEQLPEEAIRVLVRLSGINPPIGFPRMDTDRIIDGRWVRWGDLVAHWMPLPEPPKEDMT